MIPSVSNIAWVPDDRLAAYEMMARAGMRGIEIAPRIFFHEADDCFRPEPAVADVALAEIAEQGLVLTSMQSLLFGVEGAALFGDAEGRSRFISGMTRAIELAERFGIPNLVFGSPAQRRIPSQLSPGAAQERAMEVFRQLGDRALAAGTVIAIEANPAAYGTNFLNTLSEAEAFVIAADHPALRLILDLGAMSVNGEADTTDQRVAGIAEQLSHVHVSEPLLAPAPADSRALAPIVTALRECGYERAISIEMKRPADGLVGLAERLEEFGAALRAGAVA